MCASTIDATTMQGQILGDVEERIFFPTRVRVRGNKISFFVPATFLGGPAKEAWSYVVAVSGADVITPSTSIEPWTANRRKP